MKRLLGYLKNYRLESVMGPLFKMLEASFELLVPLVVAKMVDVGIKNQDVPYIMKMGLLLAGLGIVGLACSLTAQYFAAKAGVGVGTCLRNRLFAHINTLSYAEIDSVGASTLITRMTSDINQVQTGVNMVLRLFLRSPFVVFGAMLMAFTVDAQAAMVFVVTIPLLSGVVFGILLVSMPLYKKVQRQLDRVLLATRENLAGVRVVRAFNRQESEMLRFDRENSLLVRFQVFVGKISALLNPVTYVIINLAIVAVIWVGARRTDAGIITQGKVIALVNYMSQILVELIKLANLIILISKAMACMNRVNSIFELKNSLERADAGAGEDREAPVRRQQGGPELPQPIVSFCHMSFAYPGAKEEALIDLTFDVYPGQIVGIIGGTGSGKSTLVNLIPRFYDVTRGAILVDHTDVRDWRADELRGVIGVAPQRAALFSGTLRDNMKWGKKDATDQEIRRALDIAQAAEFVDRREEGLDLAIDQGGRNLSGGQRQRLTIARALVRQPRILILDDSASALDYATDLRLRKALKTSTAGMTVFLVSQRAATVKGADKILVLEDGRMAGWGVHQELLKTCAVYREICLSQLSKEEVERDEQ